MYLSDLIKVKFRKSILIYKSIVYIHTKWPNNSALQKNLLFCLMYALTTWFSMSFSKAVISPLNPLFHYNFGRKVCAACCLLRAQVATWLAVVWSNPIVKRTHHSVLTYEPANLDAPSSSLFYHIDYQDDSSKSSNQAIFFFCVWIHVMFPWIVLINVGLI